MKKITPKIILVALLIFSIVGFVATNPQIFKKANNDSSESESEYPVLSESQIKEDDFYKIYRRLDAETFLKHQVGKIGDEIHHTNLNGVESWIKVESCEISKEITDELIAFSESDRSNGVIEALHRYNEEKLDFSEGKYSALKVRFRASYKGEDYIREDFYLQSSLMLHAYEERNIFGEGVVSDTGNLIFSGRNGVAEWNTGCFVFKNTDDNYFEIIYIVPDSMLENYHFFIASYHFDNYLVDTWKYTNDCYVLDLNMNGEE